MDNIKQNTDVTGYLNWNRVKKLLDIGHTMIFESNYYAKRRFDWSWSNETIGIAYFSVQKNM